MLHVRFEMNSKFEAPKCKKNKLWMEVAKQMAELGQYAVNWEVCYTKYTNLQT